MICIQAQASTVSRPKKPTSSKTVIDFMSSNPDYETIQEPRFEDFDYSYRSSNMWNYLGNGWTHLETKDRENGQAEDLAWYLIRPREVLEAPGS